ncbi:MAG: gliding motility-associated protein GldE [Bacteroidales bacterium]|nr:gliding motility-associated protein GldE [Bacteroidales bacterium]
MIILLLSSALISGSEVALFSLPPSDVDLLKRKKTRKAKLLLNLLSMPQRTLATILITNNFVNIAIVLVSTYVLESIFDFSLTPQWLVFFIQVVSVTFLLLLFGEIIPKVYANSAALKFSKFIVLPVSLLDRIFMPLSSILVKLTSVVDKRFDKFKQNISVDVLSEALRLTENVQKDEKRILKGIVSFGNIDANGVMTPRVDVVAVDTATRFHALLNLINDSGFSRIPVYEHTFDNIKGVLYTKDLLQYIDNTDDFDWQKVIREPYFIPETKKINELLEEFQAKKNHMAIVVDEYGGANGIVTIEDVLEEIIGEMNDEYDDEELDYEKLDENTYIFEGKTLLYDFYKLLEIDSDLFEEMKGDADTIAGLFLEIKGEFPKLGEKINIRNLGFIAEQIDQRRIKKIKVIRNSK